MSCPSFQRVQLQTLGFQSYCMSCTKHLSLLSADLAGLDEVHEPSPLHNVRPEKLVAHAPLQRYPTAGEHLSYCLLYITPGLPRGAHKLEWKLEL